MESLVADKNMTRGLRSSFFAFDEVFVDARWFCDGGESECVVFMRRPAGTLEIIADCIIVITQTDVGNFGDLFEVVFMHDVAVFIERFAYLVDMTAPQMMHVVFMPNLVMLLSAERCCRECRNSD